MDDVPFPFWLSILVIALFGLAGNIRFFAGAERLIAEQLLVLMTALHTVICIDVIADMTRVLIGVSLTQASCLRFVGAFFTAFSFAQSTLCTLIVLEVIILICDVGLYRKLRVWWFHAVTYSTFVFSGWCIYMSWISEEDHRVVICVPPTAMIQEVNMIRSTWITVNNAFIVVLYAILLAILLFMTGILVSFASPISRFLNVSVPNVIITATLAASVAYSQTHYVYFFVSSDNRKAFTRMG
ncbi:hypothetical protein PMAYCL1PPCAC_17229, partial [Pristionchus mayeri]